MHNLKPLTVSVVFFALPCRRIFTETHSIESRCYRTEKYSLQARPSIFQPGKFKGWGSEGVKYVTSHPFSALHGKRANHNGCALGSSKFFLLLLSFFLLLSFSFFIYFFLSVFVFFFFFFFFFLSFFLSFVLSFCQSSSTSFFLSFFFLFIVSLLFFLALIEKQQQQRLTGVKHQVTANLLLFLLLLLLLVLSCYNCSCRFSFFSCALFTVLITE